MFWKLELSDEDTIKWMIGTYAWLLENFGGMKRVQRTKLVTPTPEDFPVLNSPNMGKAIFKIVQTNCGLEKWPCKLIMTTDRNAVAETMQFNNISGSGSDRAGAAGTFSKNGPLVTITYSMKQLEDPMSLVAVFAHELSHYLLHSHIELPPGGAKMEEHATDLCAVFLGFGIFGANSCINFSQFTQGAMYGWSASRLGYLHVSDFAFALAIFAELKGLDNKQVLRHLKSDPKAYFKQSRKVIVKEWQTAIDYLKTID